MSIEELMKPRYKVVADYPNAFAIVGSVWHEDERAHYVMHHEELDVEKYPHLFKKLQWWEERDIEDLPQYIKWTNSEGHFVRHTPEWKYIKEDLYMMLDGKDYAKVHKDDLPATIEEYNQSKPK
jgi:hypothetical protein